MTDNYYKQLSEQLIAAITDLEQTPPPAFKQWQTIFEIINKHKQRIETT